MADKIGCRLLADADCAEEGEQGFTLLEAIVALAIAALSMGLFFQMTSLAVELTAQATALQEAREIAQSLLARVGNEIPLEVGARSGDGAKGYHWRLMQSPYERSRNDANQPFFLMEVVAEVTWKGVGEARSVTLATLRAARRPPQ